jgi:hypothetical protein
MRDFNISTLLDVPPEPIEEQLSDGLLDPREVVRPHCPQPDRVPELLRLDAGDDLPGLINLMR